MRTGDRPAHPTSAFDQVSRMLSPIEIQVMNARERMVGVEQEWEDWEEAPPKPSWLSREERQMRAYQARVQRGEAQGLKLVQNGERIQWSEGSKPGC